MKRTFFRLLNFSYFSYLAVFIGSLLAILVAWQSSLWIENAEKDRFKIAVDQILFLTQKQLQSNVQMVCSSAAFFRASNNVSKDDWKIYIDAHNLEKRFPSVEVVGYAPVLPPHKRDAYQDEMRLEGFEYFHIFPPLQTDPLVPIIYIEPFNAINAKAIGFNIASEPTRKATMEKALERGLGTLSPKVEFMLDTKSEDRIGFIVYAPVFKKDAIIDSNAQKRENIVGYIFAAIRAKSLFEELADKRYIKIDYEIYDGIVMDSKSKLYDSKPELTYARHESIRTINLYGREWTFNFKANEVLDIHWSQYIPSIEAFFGILFSLVLGRWLHALQRTREEAYKIAHEKTKLLVRSEAEIRTIFQTMHEGIIVQNAQGYIIECNLAAQEIFGMSKTEMSATKNVYLQWNVVREDGTLFEPEERPIYKALRSGEAQANIIMGIEREDGKITWVQANAQPMFSDDFSHVESVFVTLSDITEYRKSKSKLEEYIALIDANVIISSTDVDGIITEVSEAFCKISGYTKEELLGKNHNIVRHKDMPVSFYEHMWETLRTGQIWFGEMKNRHKNGSEYWVEVTISPRYDDMGVIIGYTALRQDITDKKRIEELSITDRLTGLYNRLKLDELLSLHINTAHRHKTPFSTIMLDIDKFKSVNDTYGHQVGDTLLQEIATVLKTNLRLEDSVGRWGGEEFLILLPNTTQEGAVLLAEKLRTAIEHTAFSTVGKRTASFGVASYIEADDTKTIVGRADEALYRAKEKGRNRVEVQIQTCEISL